VSAAEDGEYPGGGIKLANIHADDDFPALGNGRFGRDSIVDEDNMLATYSMRLSPPFSGQVQIAETERARARTLDGKVWEIQFIYRFVDNIGPGEPVNRRKHVRVANIPHSDIARISEQRDSKGWVVDERILELPRPLASQNRRRRQRRLCGVDRPFAPFTARDRIWDEPAGEGTVQTML